MYEIQNTQALSEISLHLLFKPDIQLVKRETGESLSTPADISSPALYPKRHIPVPVESRDDRRNPFLTLSLPSKKSCSLRTPSLPREHRWLVQVAAYLVVFLILQASRISSHPKVHDVFVDAQPRRRKSAFPDGQQLLTTS
jgi:hypothetical protein